MGLFCFRARCLSVPRTIVFDTAAQIAIFASKRFNVLIARC